MSYFRNVREKEEIVNGAVKPNPYYEGNLTNEYNIECKRGYDICEDTVDNFFDNLDIYTEAFAKMPLSMNDEDTLSTLKDCILHSIEMTRNELITSMIDSEFEE